MSRVVSAVDRIREALDGRRLLWFGIRGEDGEALLHIPEFAGSFSIIARLRSSSLPEHAVVALEDLAGRREDLDTFDIDEPVNASDAITTFRRGLLSALAAPNVILPYRPSGLVSSLAFARRDSTTVAGMHHDRQRLFENKPWVETQLESRGVVGLGWKYIADEHVHLARRLLRDGPQVIRASRSSGGVGIARVDGEAGLLASWPTQQEGVVGFAPYLAPALPLNLSGCIYANGEIRLHPASVQVIGVPACTDRQFGYAGNDFGALQSLSPETLDAIDDLAMRIGRWLHAERYIGVFGVDALLHNGAVRFTEINARFQGSSALSARVARELGEVDLFLDHLAATLGLEPFGDRVTIRSWAERQPALAKVVMHNTSGAPVVRHEPVLASLGAGIRLDQLPPCAVQPGAVLGSLTFTRSITDDGFTLDPAADQAARAVVAAYDAVTVSA